MQLSTILATLASTATFALAVPAPAVERQGGNQVQYRPMTLLTLQGIAGISSGSSSYQARGYVGQCANFPSNVYGFTQANAASGLSCDIFTESGCGGSALNVATPLPSANRFGAPSRPQPTYYKSYRCNWSRGSSFPGSGH